MSNQQTVLRVQTNIPGSISGSTEYEFLDLYSSIPILINKSFAELGDIGKRNSDYSVGVLLPGSKKNNRFFENYFNVDSQSLYFNPNLRVPCQVLIDDEAYFTGYIRLNKVSVMDSKVEYDVTLYSTPAELYGSIGNNLLRDLNFADDDYTFNHVFNLNTVTSGFNYDNFALNQEEPYPYFYPVVHNGYEYTGDTVNFSGGTILSRTNLYTSTAPLNSYATLGAAYSAGVKQFRINSPTQGLYNNQLKPGLNVWSLLQLMFKTYGYSITSDFFNTPWMKTLYLYGYFSSDLTKFAFSVTTIQSLPLSGCEVFFVDQDGEVKAVVAKLGTGIPCFCASDINIRLNYVGGYSFNSTIPYGTSGLTFDTGVNFVNGSSSDVPNGTTLKYLPVNVGDTVPYVDDDYVDFSLVIDENIKQIDLLSSIAKKFNLVLIPDPNNGYNIRIEPYDFFIGTGEVHNWSNLISYDKGFTVEPALNYIESEIQFTDQEDSDEGNRLFKINNNRIYGQNYVYNPTDFKSEQKRIETIFSPELIRRWDTSGTTGNSNINLPLGINYAGSNNQIESGTSEKVNWIYKGIKTRPKLFWWLGSFNPFLDIVGEHYNATYYYKTYVAYISNSSGSTYNQYDRIPVISHTMPMGNPDSNKINNDSQCILFNSELPDATDIGVQAFNTYTENDAYSTFYEGRVSNLYDPNTRVLSGYFNLSYADLKNLQPEDLIKVNEQHFVVSKIEGFNLTNRELTKVELVQYNGQPKTYTDRYFQYFYCDNPSVKYNFKTDFTNPNLLNTNFGWSVLYDHSIGTLSGTRTGYTSTFKDVINFSTEVYIPYYIYEVNESTYNSSPYGWECDTLHQHIYEQQYGPFQYNMPTFWLNSGSTESGINLFTDCADFNTVRTTYGILTGSSITYGTGACVSPSPTPTMTVTPTYVPPSPTPTNTVTPTMTLTPSPTPSPISCFLGVGLDTNSTFDIKILSDNKLLILGSFGRYNDERHTTTVKINDDGTDDSSWTNTFGFIREASYFNYRPATFLTALELSDNKIIVTGNFLYYYTGTTENTYETTSKRYNANYIIKLNSNSTVDTTWSRPTLNEKAGTSSKSLSLQSDGKILMTGDFTTVNSVTTGKLTRLNSDGSLDTTFNSGSLGYSGNTPNGIVYLSSGKSLILGGLDSKYNGTYIYGIRRLNSDGSLDSTFNSGGSFMSGSTDTITGYVKDCAIQSDGKIIVGGDFDKYNGVTCSSSILRLNSDGTLDSTFNSGGFGFSGYSQQVFTTNLQSDGKIVVGGDFQYYNGTPVNKFLRLNSNGTLDNTFNTGTGINSTNTYPNNVAIDNRDSIYIGGDFTTYNGYFANRIIKLKSNGESNQCNPTNLYPITQDGLSINVNSDLSSYSGTGTTWYDLQGNYNGTLYNGPTWTAVGSGYYFNFDGTNQYCYFGNNSANMPASQFNTYGFGGWVRTTQSASDKIFYSRQRNDDNTSITSVIKKNSSNKFEFTYENQTGSYQVVSTTTPNNNQWYYVMGLITYNDIQIWVNGVRENVEGKTQFNIIDNNNSGFSIAKSNNTYYNVNIGDFQFYQTPTYYPQIRFYEPPEILVNFNRRKSLYGY